MITKKLKKLYIKQNMLCFNNQFYDLDFGAVLHLLNNILMIFHITC